MPPNTPGHRGLETFGTVEARDRGPMKLRSSGEPHLAEGVGFEPTGTGVPRLFKSRAFVRSAIPPDSPRARRGIGARVPSVATLDRLLADLASQLVQPLVRGLPRIIRSAPVVRSLGPARRVGTEELHARLAGMKVAEAIGNELV